MAGVSNYFRMLSADQTPFSNLLPHIGQASARSGRWVVRSPPSAYQVSPAGSALCKVLKNEVVDHRPDFSQYSPQAGSRGLLWREEMWVLHGSLSGHERFHSRKLNDLVTSSL